MATLPGMRWRLPVAFLLLTLAACSGSSSSSPAATSTSAPPSASPTPSPAPPVPTTAGAMTRALKTAHAPISGIVVYTAATDTNHLLGRPHGYLSKAAWRDRRIPPSQVAGFSLGDIDVGGGIEVFATADAATTRGGYIQGFGPSIANEYDWQCGKSLLRVSGVLTPTQAALYPRMLRRLLRTGCAKVS